MKRTRTGLPAVALLGAALLLAGCGSDTGTNDETVAGADGGKQQEPDETPEDKAPEDDGTDRPTIELPDNVQNIFEDWTSDDPKKQAVLRDARERQNGMDLAVIEQDPDADFVLFYNADSALATGQHWINSFIEQEYSVVGVVRYVDPQLTLRDDGAMVLNYCADESAASAVDISTGEKIEGSGLPVSYANVLEENEQGVWVTTSVHTEREDCL